MLTQSIGTQWTFALSIVWLSVFGALIKCPCHYLPVREIVDAKQQKTPMCTFPNARYLSERQSQLTWSKANMQRGLQSIHSDFYLSSFIIMIIKAEYENIKNLWNLLRNSEKKDFRSILITGHLCLYDDKLVVRQLASDNCHRWCLGGNDHNWCRNIAVHRQVQVPVIRFSPKCWKILKFCRKNQLCIPMWDSIRV